MAVLLAGAGVASAAWRRRHRNVARVSDVGQAGEQDAAAAEPGPRKLHHEREVHRFPLRGNVPGKLEKSQADFLL